MLKIKEYVRPESLDEAYELCTRRGNVILGGMLWLKMQDRSINTAIDLQALGLDKIEETDNEFHIGSMVTLRQLELHEGLNAQTQNAVAAAVKHIVGVQFRNLATIGGSIWGRYGFSDILTIFMVLNAKVELYKGGIVSVEEFAEMSHKTRDIITSIIVPKSPCRAAYISQRNTATDFPVLTCAVSEINGIINCAIGARPGKAKVIHDLSCDPKTAVDEAIRQLTFGSNLRGSSRYREQICGVLIRRAISSLQNTEVHP